MSLSLSHSLSNGMTRDADGVSHGLANSFAKGQALNTPGTTRTTSDVRTLGIARGDADATADGSADAAVSDDGGMSTSAETSTGVTVR
jgi:hypothetical protein